MGQARIFGLKPALKELGAHVDHGQQVVKVVRYAPRQPSNGLHLLRLVELLFHLSVLLLQARPGQDTGNLLGHARGQANLFGECGTGRNGGQPEASHHLAVYYKG